MTYGMADAIRRHSAPTPLPTAVTDRRYRIWGILQANRRSLMLPRALRPRHRATLCNPSGIMHQRGNPTCQDGPLLRVWACISRLRPGVWRGNHVAVCGIFGVACRRELSYSWSPPGALACRFAGHGFAARRGDATVGRAHLAVRRGFAGQHGGGHGANARRIPMGRGNFGLPTGIGWGSSATAGFARWHNRGSSASPERMGPAASGAIGTGTCGNLPRVARR